jgi:hypothetical protein
LINDWFILEKLMGSAPNWPGKQEATMKKRLCVAMVVALVLMAGGMASAASPPNMVAVWQGTVNFVTWNETAGYYYASYIFTYDIQNQDATTGNFYGLQNSFYPFTGNVNANKEVTIVEYDGPNNYRILTGKVTGYGTKKCKITGTMQHFLNGQVDTGTFTLYPIVV